MQDVLLTRRLKLRRWNSEDRAPFAEMNADPKVMEFMLKPLTREESDQFVNRIENHFVQHGYGLWALELIESGAFIGFAGLNIPQFEAPFMPAVEIGWRLAHPFWGQGLATEAAERALEFGFKNLGLSEIISFTIPANIRSKRVMEKLKMHRSEKDDFDHPRVPEGHSARRHIFYRISYEEWMNRI